MKANRVELTGGNSSKVYSDGRQVFRELKPQSATVHRFLAYLESQNIEFAPRFLGIEANKEVLTFVAGQTLNNYPEGLTPEAKKKVIQSTARLLKKYHQAAAGFEWDTKDVFFLEYPGKLEKSVICHNDFAPYNLTFTDGKAQGIIDFDTICPAPTEWDLAYTLYRIVPLSSEVKISLLKSFVAIAIRMQSTIKKLFIRS